ncbi:lipopolysaccharide biosynthesis protein [Klebsiella pneumoniae]|uniref:lipopolysaccharide biosynthesis protein n=1 Tax=Klebsiella pneumoniae TaxID=573 RepID=UPI0029C9F8EC|nr:lipopolysaccharide biosynthesis protein [Klebsiella pneumoniae]WPI72082.1 lipopolysaccharide biosynthesis protein [Klebsiella pneumoniae]
MSLLSNAKWNMASQIFKVLTQIINLVYLAKIIPPEEYGLMAMAMVVFNFGVLLRDLGTSAAIIQRKELSDSLINTIFWLNLFMGIGLAAVVSIFSPVISDIYEQPKLTLVLILLGLTFPLSSSASAHLALLERDSQFKRISIIEVTSALVSLIVAIAMANFGFGVYSLVAQALTLNLMSTIQYWVVSEWRPSIVKFINADELKGLFSFSANLSLFNFVNYFSRNADSFIIGKFMTVTILGSYNLAYRIMLFPLQSLTFVTTRSLYPILSRVQDDNQEIEGIYLNCVFFITLITMPLMGGVALYSEPFIRLVFGPQWHLSADILRLLAPTAIIQAILSTTGSVFMAKGKTNVLMKLGIIGAILQVGSFLIGVNYSISTFSFLYLIANILIFFQ